MPIPGLFRDLGDTARIRALYRGALRHASEILRQIPLPSSHVLRHVAVILTVLVVVSTVSPQPDVGAEPEHRRAPPAEEEAAEEGTDDAPLDVPRVLDPADLDGVEERTATHEFDGVQVDLHYAIPVEAEDLAERIEDEVAREAEDFSLAVPEARSVESEGELTALDSELAAVRLRTEETDAEASRVRYETLWYDGATGHVADSAELVADYDALRRLAQLAAEDGRVEDDAEGALQPALVHPTAKMFDSLGFNPRGDLVVEFDEGDAAAPEAGRGHLVLPAESATSLLSELGRRAQESAGGPAEGVEFAAPAESPGDLREPPGSLPPKDDGLDCSAEETKCVALTFDDGPGGRTTELLDAFAEYDGKATFFVTGGPAMLHTDVLRRIYAEGHELANHTMSHPQLTSLGAGGLRGEIEPLQAIIRRETGYTPHLMRPPYGATDDSVRTFMGEADLAEVLWSVDTSDWDDRDTGLIVKRAVDGAADGAIVLMHDIHDTTIDAVPRILEQLDEQGYTFVTTTQLLGDPEPGASYEDASDAG